VWGSVGFMLRIWCWELGGEGDERAGDLKGKVVQRRR
jgi:hypothetical protein